VAWRDRLGAYAEPEVGLRATLDPLRQRAERDETSVWQDERPRGKMRADGRNISQNDTARSSPRS